MGHRSGRRKASPSTPKNAAAPSWAARGATNRRSAASTPVRAAAVASHSTTANALRTETVTPSQLADEAIQETIYNHQILQHKLDVARQVAEKMDKLELHDHREAETG